MTLVEQILALHAAGRTPKEIEAAGFGRSLIAYALRNPAAGKKRGPARKHPACTRCHGSGNEPLTRRRDERTGSP
jgi:hypothetical protein